MTNVRNTFPWNRTLTYLVSTVVQACLIMQGIVKDASKKDQLSP